MDLLRELILSGRIIDVVIAVLLLELVAVSILHKTRGLGIAPYPLMVNIGAGGSLALAIKASITGAGWQWIATWLITSFVFHVLDLRTRWRRAS